MALDSGLIRQFQPINAEACSSLIRTCLKLDPMLPAAVKDELLRAEAPEAMCERARSFYVAVHESESGIVGVGGIDLNEICFLAVHPGHRRQGIGRSLLRHLETFVPPAFFSDIFVYAAAGAAGFYLAHGYQPAGEHEFSIRGHSLPTIFMIKYLNRGVR